MLLLIFKKLHICRLKWNPWWREGITKFPKEWLLFKRKMMSFWIKSSKLSTLLNENSIQQMLISRKIDWWINWNLEFWLTRVELDSQTNSNIFDFTKKKTNMLNIFEINLTEKLQRSIFVSINSMLEFASFLKLFSRKKIQLNGTFSGT